VPPLIGTVHKTLGIQKVEKKPTIAQIDFFFLLQNPGAYPLFEIAGSRTGRSFIEGRTHGEKQPPLIGYGKIHRSAGEMRRGRGGILSRRGHKGSGFMQKLLR
jgi:hypothetical protein